MSDDFELPTPAQSKANRAKASAPAPAPVASTPAPPTPTEPPQGEAGGGAQEEGPRWSQEELLEVFDHILFSGEYSETLVRGKRMSVTFRTRTAEEVHGIQMALDAADLRLIASVDSFRALKNLAYALVAMNGKTMPTAIAEKEAIINKLPAPVIALLFSLLQDFDSKVAAAISEGQENF